MSENLMSIVHRKDRFTTIALGIGVTVPILYFGVQLVAALLYPGYSFLSQSASQLGSDLAKYPAIFNVGAILTGLATLIASWGFLSGLRRVGTNPILSWLTALVLASSALMHLWAGIFPMPHPRHGANPFQIGTLMLPVLMAIVSWNRSGPFLRAYVIASIVLLAALMGNVVEVDRQVHDGLFQRILALTVFPPIGFAAYSLAQHLKDLPGSLRTTARAA